MRDCPIASTCSATKVGTETAGPVRDVIFERLQIVLHSGALPEPVPGNPRASCACVATLAVFS